MSCVATAPHECEGNLNFVANGLSPYWFVSKLLFQHYDGHGQIEFTNGSETWIVTLSYQKGGIAPRTADSIDADRFYEFRIKLSGNGERKANFHVRPRFANMRHYETDDPINSPFDQDHHPDEGVNVRFAGSNLEPDEYASVLPYTVCALAQQVDAPANFSSLTEPYETSNITSYERYVRVQRSMAEKVIRTSGIMNRLFQLLADQKGSEITLKLDNTEIVGYNHRLQIPSEYANELIPTHNLGKQIKHYHSKHVRTDNADDPLYHPKVGVFVKKSLIGHSISWDKRDAVCREIDEPLIDLLGWADIPTKAGSTTYVADDHFAIHEGPDVAR